MRGTLTAPFSDTAREREREDRCLSPESEGKTRKVSHYNISTPTTAPINTTTIHCTDALEEKKSASIVLAFRCRKPFDWLQNLEPNTNIKAAHNCLHSCPL